MSGHFQDDLDRFHFGGLGGFTIYGPVQVYVSLGNVTALGAAGAAEGANDVL